MFAVEFAQFFRVNVIVGFLPTPQLLRVLPQRNGGEKVEGINQVLSAAFRHHACRCRRLQPGSGPHGIDTCRQRIQPGHLNNRRRATFFHVESVGVIAAAVHHEPPEETQRRFPARRQRGQVGVESPGVCGHVDSRGVDVVG